MLSAYSMLLVAQHVGTTKSKNQKRVWTFIGGICLGFGTWTMHFIGMFAFVLPCTANYDSGLTMLSTLPAILASSFAVQQISRSSLSFRKCVRGGLLIGAGVALMHYAGMAAMNIPGFIRYNLTVFIFAAVISTAFATAALWIKFQLQLRDELLKRTNFQTNIITALMLGLAVSGMHYMSMSAAYFVRDGRIEISSSAMTPELLAMLVILVTGLVIASTIVISYFELPSLANFRNSYRPLASMIVAWGAVCWLGTSNWYDRQAYVNYVQENRAATDLLTHIVSEIERSMENLKGIPIVLAQQIEMVKLLELTDSALPTQNKSNPKIQTNAVVNSSSQAANDSLTNAAINLGADVIYILNNAGRCIASSNSGAEDSFVGEDFSERAYFTATQSGNIGLQYTVGKVSKLPGLYFSAPVIKKGAFLGAVVVKRNVSNFNTWTQTNPAFITDANGIIILAGQKSWSHKIAPDRRTDAADLQALAVQYGVSKIEPLRISSWTQQQQYDQALMLDGLSQPRLVISQPLNNRLLTVYLAQPMDSLLRAGAEQHWVFFFLFSAGALIIISSSMAVMQIGRSRRADAANQIVAAAFEAHQGMVITDLNYVILRVNKAFVRLTSYDAQDVLGHHLNFLQQGSNSPDFYADAWESLKDKDSWQGEVWSRRKDGDNYLQSLMISRVRDTAGRPMNYVVTFDDITHSKAAEQEIHDLAFYDTLTGLPNRRLLIDRLQQALLSCQRDNKSALLLFLDLDNFKSLNDNLGHRYGDILLQSVAERLSGAVRDRDTVARIGGDEFVVLLEGFTSAPDEVANYAGTLSEKFLKIFTKSFPIESHIHRCTCSIGITVLSGSSGSVDDLLKQADLAMYQAKAAGRNAWRLFDPAMQVRVSERASLEADLRQAVQEQQFLLYYQAQIGKLDRVTGAEVLVRWQHPQRGFVFPGDFIGLAEESGLIVSIGEWVLRKACEQLAVWQHDPVLQRIVVSVNISARQFLEPDFLSQVDHIISESGANPQKLKFEMTESLLAADVNIIASKMIALKSKGVGLALDDFGTGYSSLSYLKLLPLDTLKIDQSFVRNILTDANDVAIAKMIIVLAESLGLSVIAEGVESELQRDRLAQMGCFDYQGYLYSKPVPVCDFERLALQSVA